jgi:hypothetical protein
MEMGPKIIVLTPVKNEAWILNRFLSVTSKFADLIIISDQNSTDGSKDIYKKYNKVYVIENSDHSYNEASRQKQLIETARKLVQGPKILLALDSDEILAADALKTEDWKIMLKAKPGTILYFEKPDLYNSTQEVIRYNNLWPIGYSDDGCEHHPKVIHSIRIPQPEYAEHLYFNNIKILHYALTRPLAQKSKMRYYSVIENLNSTMKFYTRRKGYGLRRDFTNGHTLGKSEQKWFQGWEEEGIEMHKVSETKYYWQDFQILHLMNKYGYKKFWLDDIWYFNWEEFRKFALNNGYKDIPVFEIKNPPIIVNRLLMVCDNLQIFYNTVIKKQ